MCGSSAAATAYFVSFMVLGAFIFLNMFIAIILEGFEYSQQEEEMRINDSIIEKFILNWKKYDPLGEYLISTSDLNDLLCDLVIEELKIKGSNKKACFFHLTQDNQIVLYVKHKRGIDVDDPRMAEIIKNPTLQRRTAKAMNKFIADMMIPTYERM